jgi:TRAP transporter TAXI family solute receptor
MNALCVRASILRGSRAAVLLTIASLPACSSTKASVPQSRIVRLASQDSGRFSQQVVTAYRRAHTDFDVRLVAEPNLDSLVRGDAEVSILSDDLLYFGYSSARDRIRAIAVLHELPVHLLVSGKFNARTLADLRGRTFALTTARLPEFVLKAAGIASDITRKVAPSPRQAAQLVMDGVADAALITTYSPSDQIQEALRRGARLLPIEGREIDAMLHEHRFVRHINIPASTYEEYSRPIHTVGLNTVYVCRRDLDEAVVYDLTKYLFDALPGLSRTFPALQLLDVEQAPATPIPLHEGAARYYRELQLFR